MCGYRSSDQDSVGVPDFFETEGMDEANLLSKKKNSIVDFYVFFLKENQIFEFKSK